MKITINQGFIGKVIYRMINQNPADQADNLRWIQEYLPKHLFVKLYQQLIRVGIIDKEAISNIGRKPFTYK